MSRRNPNRKQIDLIPELISERVGNKPHAARFFAYIAQILDLPFYETSSRGAPPYDRETIVSLILYAFFKGHFSAEDIYEFAPDDIGATWILGELPLPSIKTFERIINDILENIDLIFGQILELCDVLNLIGREKAYIDGTKTKANASKHKAMSYKYLCDKIDKNQAELEVLMQNLAEVMGDSSELSDDELEDLILNEAHECYKNNQRQRQDELRQKEQEVFGGDSSQKRDVLPFNSEVLSTVDTEEQQEVETLLDNIGFKNERLENMKESKNTLETAWEEEHGDKSIPDDTQINFTDPESSIMVTKHHGVQQCYNNFGIVDDRAYIVIGAFTTNNATDKLALIPTCTHAQNFIDLEGVVLGGDAGFYSADNIEFCQQEDIDFFVSCPDPKNRFDKVNFIYDEEQDLYRCPEGQEMLPGKRVRSDAKTVSYKTEACKDCPSQSECTKAADGIRIIRRDKKKDPLREEARVKSTSPEGREVLRMRKAVVEPVWGNLLLQDGLDQHHYRSLKKASQEFKLRCVMHNLRKIFKAFAQNKDTRTTIMESAKPPRAA